MTDDALDRYRTQFNALIERHGWAAQGVTSDVPLLYSVGLTVKYGHPEIAVYGLSPHVAHGVLSAAVNLIAAGETFTSGDTSTAVLEGDLPVVFHEIPDMVAQSQFGVARWWYREQASRPFPPFVQLLWPDRQGRLPGQPGCDDQTVSLQRVQLNA